MTESYKFLSALYPEDVPAGHYLLIWTLPGKHSYWFSTIKAAAEFCDKCQQFNVYVGCGTTMQKLGEFQRAKEPQINSIPGMWLDVDIADPVHKKQNLPQSTDEALEIIESGFPEPASIVINSGHGLQLWWAFNEPLMIGSREQATAAKALSARFSATFKQLFKKKNYDVDSVFDLSRVLRVPGTMNVKDEHVPVTIMRLEDWTYLPTDFDRILVSVEEARASIPSIGGGVDADGIDIKLNENASPPFDKWEALQELDPRIIKTWKRERRDFQDKSPSSYDMALATFAYQVGWTDQEIVDLLIAARRKNGEDLKLRLDYYQRTLKRVKDTVKVDKAQEELENLAAECRSSEATEIPMEKKEDIMGSLCDMLAIPIVRIVKYITDPPTYRLETRKSNINLGDVNGLIVQGAFKSKVAASTGILLPEKKKKEWETLAQLLLNACVEEDVGDESTDVGMVHSWVKTYLDERGISDSAEESIGSGTPFRDDAGNIFIYGTEFRKWVKVSQMDTIPAKQMGTLLRGAGCLPEKINVTIDGKPTSRNVWKVKKGK